ncbi:TPA: hypothetical protein UNJ94_000284 [Stenotrophomonas maltophilia]|nr:hypothetical protein [Stenotrophomonas maltophilia]
MNSWIGWVECGPLSSTCVVDWGPVTTLLAVLVALGVGVAPVIRDRAQRTRLARMVARISVSELELLEQRLLVSAGVIKKSGNMLDHWKHKEVKRLLIQVSADGVTALIPHVHNISEDLERRLAKCISLLRAFERSTATIEKTRPSQLFVMGEDGAYYSGLAKELAELRRSLCTWTKSEFEDLAEAVKDGVIESMNRAAEERENFRMHNPPSRDHLIEPS